MFVENHLNMILFQSLNPKYPWKFNIKEEKKEEKK